MTQTAFSVLDIPVFKMELDERLHSDKVLLILAERRTMPEPEVIQLMKAVVRPGDCVVDGGANVGFFTLLLSRLVGETGRVHAFEPLPMNAIKLRQNIEINKLDNVIIHQEALTSHEGVRNIWHHPDNGQASIWPDAQSHNPVEVVINRLDHFMLTPRLIKLDLEGAEHHALEGARGTLIDANPFVVSEMNEPALRRAGSSPEALRTAFYELGFEAWELSPEGGRPKLYSAKPIEPDRLNLNALFARRGRINEVWPE